MKIIGIKCVSVGDKYLNGNWQNVAKSRYKVIATISNIPPTLVSSGCHNTNSTGLVKNGMMSLGGVGKTCLFIRECKGTYPETYIPQAFKNYTHDIEVEGKYVEMEAVDPTGTRGDYDRLRPLSYPNTDVFLICFDLSNLKSFENVRDVWHPEVKKHCPTVPTILVGTKLDLREDDDGTTKVTDEFQAITNEQGREMQAEIGALAYIECSAITGKGVNTVFYEAVKQALLLKPKSKKSCNLL